MSEAKTAVLRQLGMAYERLAVDEQLSRTKDPALANDFHDIAVRVLRARMAEEDNRPVPAMPVHCLNCAAAYAKGGTA